MMTMMMMMTMMTFDSAPFFGKFLDPPPWTPLGAQAQTLWGFGPPIIFRLLPPLLMTRHHNLPVCELVLFNSTTIQPYSVQMDTNFPVDGAG